ncbi:hypothetical protein U1Q18_033566 [Sarracenia purpurea var. burkii]
MSSWIAHAFSGLAWAVVGVLNTAVVSGLALAQGFEILILGFCCHGTCAGICPHGRQFGFWNVSALELLSGFLEALVGDGIPSKCLLCYAGLGPVAFLCFFANSFLANMHWGSAAIVVLLGSLSNLKFQWWRGMFDVASLQLSGSCLVGGRFALVVGWGGGCFGWGVLWWVMVALLGVDALMDPMCVVISLPCFYLL